MAQAYSPEDVTDVEDVYLCYVMCKQNNKVIISESLNRDRGYKARDILHIPVHHTTRTPPEPGRVRPAFQFPGLQLAEFVPLSLRADLRNEKRLMARLLSSRATKRQVNSTLVCYSKVVTR